MYMETKYQFIEQNEFEKDPVRAGVREDSHA